MEEGRENGAWPERRRGVVEVPGWSRGGGRWRTCGCTLMVVVYERTVVRRLMRKIFKPLTWSRVADRMEWWEANKP